MMSEFRHALRRLLRDRWTTVTAVLTVALGAGVSLAVFAAGYGLLRRPLPYDEGRRLHLLDVRVPAGQLDDWRDRLRGFERLTGYAAERMVVGGIGDPQQVRGAYVDGEFFDLLRTRPLAGRVLRPDDVAAAVVSERFARTVGRSQADLPGTRIMAGEAALTIVGVLPASFAFPSAETEIWIPAINARPVVFDRSPDARRFRLAGWLRPGVSASPAAAEIARVEKDLQPDARARDAAAPVLEAAHTVVTRDVRGAVLVLGGAAALLWIVTCANLATLLIGRVVLRRQELAVCRALGAGVWRRATGIFSEALVITLAGSVLGAALALTVTTLTTRWAGAFLPRPGDIRFDAGPAAVAALSALAMALVATVPSLIAARRGGWNLRHAQAAVTRRDRRLRGGLLVAQVALVVVLMSAGALLLRTLDRLLRTDLGLDARDTLVSQLVLTPTTAYEAAERWPVLRDLLSRVRALPGVRAAGAGSSLPPDVEQVEITLRLTGDTGEASHRFSAAVVTPGYLEAIGARLLEGRYFEEADLTGAPVVILSETAARAVLKDRPAAGAQLPFAVPGVSDRRHPTVVGVVADIRYSGLDSSPDAAIYVPWHLAPMGQGFLAVEIRDVEAAAVASAIRGQLRTVDPAMPHMPMRRIQDGVDRAIGVRRVAALIGATLAMLAFAVALGGLAGNVLRSVAERRREVAIRGALGATPSQLVGLIARGVFVLAIAGLAVGTAGALAAGRVLRTLVVGVRLYDPVTLLAVGLVVIGASAVVSLLPARAVVRIDPGEVLRNE